MMRKMGKRLDLSEQLRRAIDTSGSSRYSICQAIGLDAAVMSRFMSGTSGLSIETIDRLGRHLGLQITKTRKPRTAPRAKAKRRKGDK